MPFWRGLGDGFRSFLGDFGWILGCFQRRPISKPKLEAEKVVLGTQDVSRPEGQAALILIVDQPIIDNVDRRSLKSFIVR